MVLNAVATGGPLPKECEEVDQLGPQRLKAAPPGRAALKQLAWILRHEKEGTFQNKTCWQALAKHQCGAGYYPKNLERWV